MGLFDWLAGLFGGKPDETPEDVADRMERIADRFANAGDDDAAAAARTAADEARRAPTTAAAKQIEIELLQSRSLRPDGRPMKPLLGRGPDDAEYVRYGTTLQTGGSRAWRFNNPGYVRCSSRSTYYGALGCDGEFAIFPNYTTGINALRLNLRDDYPGRPVGDALREHLPPGVDASRVCEKAGLDPGTKVEDVTPEDFGGMGPALEIEPGWDAGEKFDRGADDSPAWVETAWSTSVETHTGGVVSPDAEFGGSAETGPTDNS
jgi:hypothetical protein